MGENMKIQYKCLGCGKIYNTYKIYPNGIWICLKCRDNTKVPIICSVCGSTFEVEWNTYRMKDPNIPWRCRSCNDKYRNILYENKSEEEKQKFIDQQRKRSKSYWNNLSEKEKEQDSQRRKELWKKRYENGNASRILNAMKEGRSNWWNSLSDEEKVHQMESANNGRKIWFDHLSDEELKEWKSMIAFYSKLQWSKLDINERTTRMKNIHKGNKEFWEEMMKNKNKYHEWYLKQVKGYREYRETVDPKNENIQPNKNEKSFIDILNKNGLEYYFQYPNIIIHPDFDKIFPNNPITKSDLVSPFHNWDFLVRTLDEDVFIDIDGSIHFHDSYSRIHPYTKVKYRILDASKFNDSQRPYQTDGLMAYAVLCYDDNLTMDTPVKNINTGDIMPFSALIALLNFMNMKKKDKSQFIRENN